jgi:DNA-binding winged helix-turn-helix (wHTH) protein
MPTAPRMIRFSNFELDRHTLELRRNGAPVKLQQQPARVLVMLFDRAGELVTREELQRELWGEETFVDFDRGLNYCVSQIRTALGDSAETPRFLETLRGRGYRFVGGGHPARRAGGTPALLGIAAAIVIIAAAIAIMYASRAQTAIGIAPLTAPVAEQQWAGALRTQLMGRLAMASRTPVIDLAQSPTSKTRWRVEGRVDRSAEQYRVTMLLRDTRDGSVRWSDIFAGTPGDWIDAQSEMADRMTEIIRYRIEGPSAGLPMRRRRLPSSRAMM